MSNSSSDIEKRELETLARALEREDRLIVWRGVAVAVIAIFYWLLDTFVSSGHPWGRIEWSLVCASVFIVPSVWTWNARRRVADEIRDRRVIRIEVKLDQLLNRERD